MRLSLLCDAIRRDVLDASSDSNEEDSDEGRDSAYALEGSQAIQELEKPEDLISVLSDRTQYDTLLDGIADEQYKAAENTQKSVDFSGKTVTIDPILVHPPQFIERNGKLLMTTMAHTGASEQVDI